MTTRITIARHFFSHDVVIHTSRTVQQNAALLQQYLASEERPKGFVVRDPGLDGSVFGAAFTLQPRDALLWGWGFTPDAGGCFVPTDRGSNVVLHASLPTSSRWVIAGTAVLFSSITLAAEPSLAGALAGGALASAAVALVGIVNVAFHGEHITKIMTAIFH